MENVDHEVTAVGLDPVRTRFVLSALGSDLGIHDNDLGAAHGYVVEERKEFFRVGFDPEQSDRRSDLVTGALLTHHVKGNPHSPAH